MGMNNNARSLVTAGAVERYRLVTLGSAGTVTATSAATDRAVGITGASSYASGANALVEMVGVHKVTASAAIEEGVLVVPAADGKVVTDAGTATHIPCGIALEPAGADGDVIEILFVPGLPANA